MSLKTQCATLTGALCLTVASMAMAGDTTRSEHAAVEFRHAETPIEGRYIVVLKDEVARLGSEARSQAPTVASVARNVARSYGMDLQETYTHALRGFVVEADDRALARLLMDERVAFVEEDGMVSIKQSTQPNATWGLDRVDQRDLPLDGNYVYDTTASGVNTYIVDTGVRPTHNDFGNRVTTGYTAINDGRGSNDCNGHGTHVAGTVAGSTWGVAKAATIHPVRVLDCRGSGSNSGVIAGMDWVAANHSKPAVANMSLGGGASTATDNAVSNMRNAGVTVVVAAGNENQNACNVSPARSADAITVGSTTSNDTRSGFSNFGNCVDIFAPGSDITAPWHTSNSATNTISGTSMAAPHVAGIAALYLADNGTASPTQVENAIFDNGSTGKLSSINTGSPNLLAYSRFGDDDGGGDDGGGDDGGTGGELENGVAETNLSGGQGSETFFTIEVPADAEDLLVEISGGTGDADLYVRFGAEPTTDTYDCRPWLNGNDESCDFDDPQAGTWHIMIRGYEAYAGVDLVASFEEPAGGGGNELANGEPVTGLSGQQGSETFFTMEVPDTASSLEFAISGGTGDADLYVRFGAEPTTNTYDCRPWLVGNEETCDFDDPQAGTWHVMIRGYEAYSGVDLVGSFDESAGVPCSDCDLYTGSLGDGDSEVQPDGTWYQAGGGTHSGWLVGPAGADFDLELYRWNGSGWNKVAEGTSPDSNEFVEYSGNAGYYYWRVRSHSGSGSYELYLDTP